jgi:predicted ATPase
MPNTCENCQFFDRKPAPATTSALYLSPAGDNLGHGLCRRYAPKPGVLLIPWWPRVNQSDWCGEHKLAARLQPFGD